MRFNSRVKVVSCDENTYKYQGEIEFFSMSGGVKSVRIAIADSQRWPFERVSRALINVERFRELRARNGGVS